MLSRKFLNLGLLPCLLLAPQAIRAQGDESLPDTAVAAPEEAHPVAFSADQLDYDSEAEIVTASGNVLMERDGARLVAGQIVWNRGTGEVTASGNVAIANANGDTAYGDTVTLTDSLRDGVIENLLMVLSKGGRLVAAKAVRTNDVTTLTDAAYSPCSVVASDGCPKEPVWKISSVRVTHNPAKRRIFYEGARLSLFGAPLFWLPGFSHPDGSDSSGTGFLVPDIRFSRTNGFELSMPWYYAAGPNRDLKLTPHVYSRSAPALAADYRVLTATGAYEAKGMVTYARRSTTSISEDPTGGKRDIRAYVDLTGRFQPDPLWTLSGTILRTTDKTFMRRYDVSDADRLRSTLNVERIDEDSYLSIAGWATQTLRLGDAQRQQPIALPAIDWRRRLTDPVAGGNLVIQANSLALLRHSGQDTQRAFLGLNWNLRRRTAMGQDISMTLYGRGDVYHSSDTASTLTEIYRGSEGWTTRAIGAAAIDVRWPFFGPLAGGTQQLTPRVQLVGTPGTANLKIPNEDARAFDLEDSNLFALNRFAGYDRWEDASRVTYGFEWNYARPNLAIDAVVGQSYRLSDANVLTPTGTGLSDRFSNIVGRTTIRFRDNLSLTHRFRIDKDSFSIRRNEINATVGSAKTYALAGYLRLNRDVDTTLEDLRDREEIQLAGRVQFARFWSLFGSTVIDLTDQREDPASSADGYQPVRHRVELLYEDDCVQFGVSWRRDYEEAGDARRGNSFLLRLALKNLGR